MCPRDSASKQVKSSEHSEAYVSQSLDAMLSSKRWVASSRNDSSGGFSVAPSHLVACDFST